MSCAETLEEEEAEEEGIFNNLSKINKSIKKSIKKITRIA